MLLGVVVGVVWWALAPTAHVVRLDGGSLAAPAAPELAAAQDGVLSFLAAGAGLLSGLVAAALPSRAPLARSLVVLVAGGAGQAVAVGVGHLLGPASVRAQLAAHPARALTSPLSVHSPAVWLVWPAVAALVMAGGHLLSTWRPTGEDAVTDAGADGRGGGPRRPAPSWSPPPR